METLHTYLVFTDGLSVEDRKNLYAFLDRISYMSPVLRASTACQNPQYIVYLQIGPEDIPKLSPPVPFKWKCLDGMDISKLS